MESIGNLFICDNEYLESAPQYYETALQIEEKMNSFFAVVESMQTEAAFTGICATNFYAFSAEVKAALSINLSAAVQDLRNNMAEYISQIDVADDCLY